MSRIAKKVRPGRRVQQGQVIGYVGSTGRSTGAHLHYEILRRGVQINPLTVKFPTGKKLAGAELKNFKNNLTEIDEMYASLPVMTKEHWRALSKSERQKPGVQRKSAPLVNAFSHRQKLKNRHN